MAATTFPASTTAATFPAPTTTLPPPVSYNLNCKDSLLVPLHKATSANNNPFPLSVLFLVEDYIGVYNPFERYICQLPFGRHGVPTFAELGRKVVSKAATSSATSAASLSEEEVVALGQRAVSEIATSAMQSTLDKLSLRFIFETIETPLQGLGLNVGEYRDSWLRVTPFKGGGSFSMSAAAVLDYTLTRETYLMCATRAREMTIELDFHSLHQDTRESAFFGDEPVSESPLSKIPRLKVDVVSFCSCGTCTQLFTRMTELPNLATLSLTPTHATSVNPKAYDQLIALREKGKKVTIDTDRVEILDSQIESLNSSRLVQPAL